MSNYKERVKDEHSALANNINKLNVFINSDAFDEVLSKVEQNLLKQQLDAMENYLDILSIRVNLHNFTK